MWTREKILKRIAIFIRKQHRLPLFQDFNSKNRLPSYVCLRKYLGGIKPAVSIFGMLKKKRRDYTREELITILRELFVRLGRRPRISDLKGMSVSPFNWIFGTWKKALMAANIPILLQKKGAESEVIVDKYRSAAKKLGRKLTKGEVKKYLGITQAALTSRFGSLTNFYAAIKLNDILKS